MRWIVTEGAATRDAWRSGLGWMWAVARSGRGGFPALRFVYIGFSGYLLHFNDDKSAIIDR